MDQAAVNALREKQAKIATDMRALVDDACEADEGKEARGFDGEDDQKWQNMDAEFERLGKVIERAQRALDIDTGLETVVLDYNARGNPGAGSEDSRLSGEHRETTQTAVSAAVRDYYSAESRVSSQGFGIEPTIADAAEYIDAFRAEIRQGGTYEQRQVLLRAAQSSTTTAGGYTIPTGFRADIEVAMAAFGGIRNVATIWPTPTGNPIEWPTVNDTTVSGRLLTENSASTNTAITFAQLTFNAYKYSSDHILVPIELAQDTGIALEAVIARLLGERLGRITSSHYATGTGSSQPNGLVTAATAGETCASATAITMAEIINLIHSVDPAYRQGPGVGFVFSDATLKYLKGLRDEANSNRPLWAPNIAEAVPATIDGYGYQIDQNVPSIGDNSPDGSEKVAVFGSLGKYMIRDVLDMSLSVLRELYAGNHQIGYVAIMRTDSDLLDAGVDPVKALVMG